MLTMSKKKIKKCVLTPSNLEIDTSGMTQLLTKANNQLTSWHAQFTRQNYNYSHANTRQLTLTSYIFVSRFVLQCNSPCESSLNKFTSSTTLTLFRVRCETNDASVAPRFYNTESPAREASTDYQLQRGFANMRVISSQLAKLLEREQEREGQT